MSQSKSLFRQGPVQDFIGYIAYLRGSVWIIDCKHYFVCQPLTHRLCLDVNGGDLVGHIGIFGIVVKTRQADIFWVDAVLSEVLPDKVRYIVACAYKAIRHVPEGV